MARLLVLEQSVDDYLTLVTRVIPLNENHVENLIIIVLRLIFACHHYK